MHRLPPLGDGSYALCLLHNLILDLAFAALVAVGASDRHGWGATLAVLICRIASTFAQRFAEAPSTAGLIRFRRAPVAGVTVG